MCRPERLQIFINAYRATAATLPIHVVLDAADAHRYSEIVLPAHWIRTKVPAGTRLGEIFNLLFKKFPNEEYYGMIADDVLPETHLWDIVLRDACLPDKISWGADGIQNENLPIHPFIGGDLVRKLGWWAAPGIRHWYVDNVWKNLSVDLNCARYLPNIKMTHIHHLNGRRRSDRTDVLQPSHDADGARYIEFMNSEYPRIIRRLKQNAGKINAGSL